MLPFSSSLPPWSCASLSCPMARFVGLIRMVSFGGFASRKSACASCVTLSNLHGDADGASSATTEIRNCTLVELLGFTKRSVSCDRSDENAADALALQQKPGLAAGVSSIQWGWQWLPIRPHSTEGEPVTEYGCPSCLAQCLALALLVKQQIGVI